MSQHMRQWFQSVRRRRARRLHGMDQRETIEHTFHNHHYLRLTARTLEHLASLGLALSDRTVLEVGAGTGDYSSFFLDRNCRLTITEVRPELLAYLQMRYPDQDIRYLDLERPKVLAGAPFEVVFCYGTLYHLQNPAAALTYLSDNCSGMLLISTQVIFGDEARIEKIDEPQERLDQSNYGRGTRFTRRWLYEQLCGFFPYVYTPITQPVHVQFPCNWFTPPDHNWPIRANFVAAKHPLDAPLLTLNWLDRHERQV